MAAQRAFSLCDEGRRTHAARQHRIVTTRSGELLFAYGTLLEPAERRRLLGRELAVEPATLHGFRRGRQQYYFVTRAGDHVEGAVLSGLDAQDLQVLDEYEEVPWFYTRARVTVEAATGENLECWIYLPTSWVDRKSKD